ncbi:transposase [Companilactobacillus suantsaicola]|nr:transposase [Companilactobacillus suantsaicola]
MNVKILYDILCRSKWSSKEKYLYSSVVIFNVDGHDIPVKLVFVTKRGDKDNYLVLGTTKMNLRYDQIVQMYGRCWQIESYFKVAKQYLQFDKTQIQSYDGFVWSYGCRFTCI